jgi:hypothetical protein
VWRGVQSRWDEASKGGRTYPVEEEVEERGVVDVLDLRPAPIVPGPVPYRPLRLRRGRRGERGCRGERWAEAGAQGACQQHHGHSR